MPNLEIFNNDEVVDTDDSGLSLFASMAVPYVLVRMAIDPHDGSTPAQRGAHALNQASNIGIFVAMSSLLIVVGIMIFNYLTGQ